ncbi:hypothetical protein LSH36_110g05130 [Paralvinella palmiformis]|uniref:Sulfhydryl oxidase flavin adenine dinucleotide (FAD) binding domain-containing protein n=1 Tax=Paralvinella palmiformis TaxID=53620 RepID=A0AAD9JYV0_9ANNE|nr:hypothetical protein LSH36_110g05130 [Paralvinella palmiformis]
MIETHSSQHWIPDSTIKPQQDGQHTDQGRTTTPAPRIPHKLTPADLESNIHYMLWTEVATHKKIRGGALTALKMYMQVLTKPFDPMEVLAAIREANNRLHGDPTEDPAYPKIQFPGPALCPTCRYDRRTVDKFDNETNWNIPEVLKFLRDFYSKKNIFEYPLTTPSLAAILPTVVPYTGTNGWHIGMRTVHCHSFVYLMVAIIVYSLNSH